MLTNLLLLLFYVNDGDMISGHETFMLKLLCYASATFDWTKRQIRYL